MDAMNCLHVSVVGAIDAMQTHTTVNASVNVNANAVVPSIVTEPRARSTRGSFATCTVNASFEFHEGATQGHCCQLPNEVVLGTSSLTKGRTRRCWHQQVLPLVHATRDTTRDTLGWPNTTRLSEAIQFKMDFRGSQRASTTRAPRIVTAIVLSSRTYVGDCVIVGRHTQIIKPLSMMHQVIFGTISQHPHPHPPTHTHMCTLLWQRHSATQHLGHASTMRAERVVSVISNATTTA
jgi:hypothetical protein